MVFLELQGPDLPGAHKQLQCLLIATPLALSGEPFCICMLQLSHLTADALEGHLMCVLCFLTWER